MKRCFRKRNESSEVVIMDAQGPAQMAKADNMFSVTGALKLRLRWPAWSLI